MLDVEKTPSVLITGATGHVGYALLLELMARGFEPAVLVRKSSALFDTMKCTQIYGDVTSPESLEKAFEGVHTVYHLAGYIDINKGNDEKVFAVNYDGTLNVIEACKKCKVRKLVFMSSVDTYLPLPDNAVMTELNSYNPDLLEGTYAKSKAMATQAVLDSNCETLETLVIQPSACIGPYDFKMSSITSMIKMFMEGKFPVSLSFGEYNFVDVRDVASATCDCVQNGKAGECYILCGETLTVDEFIKALAKVTGRKAPKIMLGKEFLNAIAPLAEAYYEKSGQTPMITRYSVRKLGSNCNFSNAKAKSQLGFSPMSVEQSLKDTVKWLEEQE